MLIINKSRIMDMFILHFLSLTQSKEQFAKTLQNNSPLSDQRAIKNKRRVAMSPQHMKSIFALHINSATLLTQPSASIWWDYQVNCEVFPGIYDYNTVTMDHQGQGYV